MHSLKKLYLFRSIAVALVITFITSTAGVLQPVYAQELALPAVGSLVPSSPDFAPPVIEGIKIDPQNPLNFDFLINPGQSHLTLSQKQAEYKDLIDFFLASLTTPEADMWVNLSPYEHNRVISSDFGATEMGRDMLAQDYILKQLTASLIYPESNLGKQFWQRIYSRVQEQFGNTAIPVNTFNKVWILPQSATVFEKGNVAIVVKSHLRVMLEEDYMALSHNPNVIAERDATHGIGSQIIREIVLPELEREVNEGKNFAQLRQMYHSMILASWFKQRLKKHLFQRVYINQHKDAGIQLQDPNGDERVYRQYIRAFKRGVFNYIKEESDPASGQVVPRRYFSGGFTDGAMATAANTDGAVLATTDDPTALSGGRFSVNIFDQLAVRLNPTGDDVITAQDGERLSKNEVVQFLVTGLNKKALEEKLNHFKSDYDINAVLRYMADMSKGLLKENIAGIIPLIKYLSKTNGGVLNWGSPNARLEAENISILLDIYLASGKTVKAATYNSKMDLYPNTQGFTEDQNRSFAGNLNHNLEGFIVGASVDKADALREMMKTFEIVATHEKPAGKDRIQDGLVIAQDNTHLYMSDVLGLNAVKLKRKLQHFVSVDDRNLALELLRTVANKNRDHINYIDSLAAYLNQLPFPVAPIVEPAPAAVSAPVVTPPIVGVTPDFRGPKPLLMLPAPRAAVVVTNPPETQAPAVQFSPRFTEQFLKAHEAVVAMRAKEITSPKVAQTTPISEPNLGPFGNKTAQEWEAEYDRINAQIYQTFSNPNSGEAEMAASNAFEYTKKSNANYDNWKMAAEKYFASKRTWRFTSGKEDVSSMTAHSRASEDMAAAKKAMDQYAQLVSSDGALFKIQEALIAVESNWQDALRALIIENEKGNNNVSEKVFVSVDLSRIVKTEQQVGLIPALIYYWKRSVFVTATSLGLVALAYVMVFGGNSNTNHPSVDMPNLPSPIDFKESVPVSSPMDMFNKGIQNTTDTNAPGLIWKQNQMHSQRNGGIDFNDQYLQMNLEGQASDADIPAGFAWLLNTPIQGFTAHILEIRSGIGSSLPFFKNVMPVAAR